MPRNDSGLRQAALLLRPILRGGDREMSLEQQNDYIKSVRQESQDISAHLDRMLLMEIDKLRGGLANAQNLHVRLKDTLTALEQEHKNLTAPPLVPATFIDMRPIQGSSSALVSYNNTLRFVNIAGEVNGNSLQTGDQVLLGGNDLNVLVDTVTCKQFDCGETAVFERYATDGRLILLRREEEIIVNTSDRLRRTELKKGDIVRWNPNAWIAFEKIERCSDHYFLETPPRVSFNDIGGLDETIEEIKAEILLHFKYAMIADRYNVKPLRCLLLWGPPGTGKTMLVKALVNWLNTLATEGKALFINIKPGSLGSMWYGQTESRIREIFRAAREAAELQPSLPVVIYFDEVDSIAHTRGLSLNGVDDRVLTSLAAELDGLEDRGNILVVASTNRLDIIDPAMSRSGRFGDKKIEVPRPNREAARGILSKYFTPKMVYGRNRRKNAASREEIIDAALSKLYSANGMSDIATLYFRDATSRTVKASELVNGATIAGLVRECARLACMREIETGDKGIQIDDVLTVVEREIEKMASMLTTANCRRHLNNLPQDNDIVRIEPVRRRRIRTHRYIQVA